ncbi:hypothetical protein C2S53_007729 [Perilla frutescens var. hirtella]|uniref:Transposase Tnp1/En/Spm-like domain-containing protein n=1 Tax=Perilla frutescens var. hirtella TaxID=608512 RepID=A0AAD4P1A7_PERFH|nr:hypothetical protein C2S53_007729 [Perilla frutescens var. hirtella]
MNPLRLSLNLLARVRVTGPSGTLIGSNTSLARSVLPLNNQSKMMTSSTIRPTVPRKSNHESHEEQIEEYEQQSGHQQNLESTASAVQGTEKQIRGPTYLPNIWTRNPNEGRILVSFNKKGQPVGPNKKTFTRFLGTLARNSKFTPFDIEDWRKVPKVRKDELITMVKVLKHGALDLVVHRQEEETLEIKNQCFIPTLPIENQVHNRPIRVNEDQWKNLLPYWIKEDIEKISDKNKDHQQCSVMKHTTGKLSFAEIEEELKERLGRSPSRVEMFDACFTDLDGNPSSDEVASALDEMKEVQSKMPPGLPDPVGPSDSFAKVMGKDPHGRVRILGLGVNATDISGDIPSRSACYRMVLENQVAITRMEDKMDEATKLIAKLQDKLEQNATTRRPTSPGQSSNSINLEHSFQVGDSVFLKSLFDSSRIVAKGCIRNIDPNHDVGGKRLGVNCCEVLIYVPIEWDEDLIRPYSNLSTIGEAIGTCIAWPHHLVVDVGDQE